MSADPAKDQAGPTKSEQPANLTNDVRDISRHPVGFGGFSDIYTGIWDTAEGEKKVALKVLRVRAMDAASKKMLRQLLREISVWKRLSHPNIHSLYGLYDGIGPAPAMVSTWCKNGDINNYISDHEDGPDIDVLKLKLFVGVMAGLRFLHDNFIIHGDIKGGNVLISDDGVPQLCDFGLSRLLWGSTQSISHTGGRGTLPWMAPELLVYGEVHSYKSDIWASGCLLVEVWTGRSPYPPSYNDQQILLALSQKQGPPRPDGMTDFASNILGACCSFDRDDRPAPVELMARFSVQLVMPRMSKLVTRMRSPETFDTDLLDDIENSLQSADAHQTAELYSLNEHDLAIAVIRILSLWSLGLMPGPQRYTSSLYKWCLDTVVHRQPLPLTDTRMSSGSDGGEDEDDKDNEFAEDSLVDPSKLRPFARLLAAVDPAYADVAMLRFGRASIGTPIRFEEEKVPLSVVWFPDGDRIAVGSSNGTVDILSTSSGATIRRLNGHEGWVNQVAISPDGRLLASCSDDHTVRLWDAETGNAVGEPKLGHSNEVFSVAFSSDGNHIASGSLDNTIRIWSCETGMCVIGPLYGHTSYVSSVAFSPDGTQIVSGSYDTTMRVWDSRTGACILGPLLGHARDINSVAFSPNGSRFVSGSDDGTVRIWDAFRGEPIGAPMEGHHDAVRCVAYSPDGAHIASGSCDYTIRIWDAATSGLIRRPLRGHPDWVESVVFSPDGRKLASASPDRTVRIWDATDEWTRWDI